MKRKYGLVAQRAAIVLFILLLAAFISVKSLLNPATSPEKAVNVVVKVEQNLSTYDIGKVLKRNGLIKNAFVFSFYTRLKGLDDELKAGEYHLSSALSIPEIVEKMVQGRPVMYTFTIPEGYTVEQVANMLAEKGLADRDKFLQVVENGSFDYPFFKDLPEGPNRLEGYLFPDTYRVGKDCGEDTLVDLMLNRFNEEIKKLNLKARAENLGLTLHEAVTIASMIEKEALKDNERALISGVIFNRLRKGMLLQVDATVLYALGEHRPVVYYKDLEIDSPYNTYKYPGLPPGPIASPGRASLIAAVEPARTDYFYYVAKPDGSHAFACTLREHNANKRKYLK